MINRSSFYYFIICFTSSVISHPQIYSSAVNINIKATVDENGKWDSKVNVNNSDESLPKHIVSISHDVNSSGITFSSHIDGVYQLHLSCTQEKKINMIEKLRDNYVYKPDLGFYKYHEVASTWHNAWKTCIQENAHLVIINSEKEAQMLVELLSPKKPIPGVDSHINNFVDIGFHDLFSEGQYYTIQGQPLSESGFTKWGGGQPDNAGNNENCGSFHRSGVLNDMPCTIPVSFVCERDLY